MEKRIEEVQSQTQVEEVGQPDTSRFIALVNKYRNRKEMTDIMSKRVEQRKKIDVLKTEEMLPLCGRLK